MLVIAAQKKVSFLVGGGDGTAEVEAIMVSFVFAIIFAHWFSLVLASMWETQPRRGYFPLLVCASDLAKL
jgi:hypothetical protein